MLIKIISVESSSKSLLDSICYEFEKKLKFYCKLDIVSVKNFISEEISKIIKEESKNIASKISDEDFVILCDINSNQLKSEDFSSMIQNKLSSSRPMVFVIGGSYGVDKDLVRHNQTLSFSKMTFPHKLFKTILLEQIYRAFKIINNEDYHK